MVALEMSTAASSERIYFTDMVCISLRIWTADALLAAQQSGCLAREWGENLSFGYKARRGCGKRLRGMTKTRGAPLHTHNLEIVFLTEC